MKRSEFIKMIKQELAESLKDIKKKFGEEYQNDYLDAALSVISDDMILKQVTRDAEDRLQILKLCSALKALKAYSPENEGGTYGLLLSLAMSENEAEERAKIYEKDFVNDIKDSITFGELKNSFINQVISMSESKEEEEFIRSVLNTTFDRLSDEFGGIDENEELSEDTISNIFEFCDFVLDYNDKELADIVEDSIGKFEKNNKEEDYFIDIDLNDLKGLDD